MRGIFTPEERAVVLFLAVSLLAGSALVQARRVFPGSVPDFSGASEGPVSAAVHQAQPQGPVDVNTAGVDELVRLPGIGPAKAELIVRQRELRGGYTSLEELLEVKGIGPATLAKLRDEATVGKNSVSVADSSGMAAEPESQFTQHDRRDPS